MLKIFKKKIGIIGFGNMGSAIAQRIKARYCVSVFDKEKSKIANVAGIKAIDNIADLANKSDVVILAVKPQDFDIVLDEVKGHIEEKLIISIAAGITTGYIEKALLGRVRVIRVMPNLPAKVGEGISCLCKGGIARDSDLKFTQEIFKNVGKTLVIKEDLMNAATAVSGSGPGFNYDLVEDNSVSEAEDFTLNSFIPALTATATDLGFTTKQAKLLAETTGRGSIIYLKTQKISASQAKAQVTSKNGTTEAGLSVLKHDIKNLEEAVKAAQRRAEELSK